MSGGGGVEIGAVWCTSLTCNRQWENFPIDCMFDDDDESNILVKVINLDSF